MFISPDDLAELCAHVDTQPCTDLGLDPEAVFADRSRWPDHVCSDLCSTLRLEWAGAHAHRVAGTNRIGMRGGYSGERWISSGDHRPIAIGRESIPTSFPIRHFSSDVRRDADQFAVFPGDDHLLFPLVTRVNCTMIETFFLAREEQIDPTFHIWQAGGVKFRVLHEHGTALDEEAKAFIKNAKEWWADFGERVVLRPGIGGRKPIRVAYRHAAMYFRKLNLAYAGARQPSLNEIAEAITYEEGVTVSGRTLRRRLDNEWRDRPWPPR